ncbi:trehalose 6-phosphate phosphatase [Sinorhizobium kostiense]|uniref:Trehalose 6-phosphate phosphatase n=1 Tax=Sinorhizobium kostiense TaxID=76747 RepID=A0ABS4R3Q6_9HYPH|nr:trehalose-phosphatase [Sinorhizobium kostiense]MBP2237522.1 trehalose 6-phosphate phosphatase [Sinorhizobium kostiense]
MNIDDESETAVRPPPPDFNGSALEIFSIIEQQPSRSALYLDIDGTLLDIAPTPEAIVVPPGLADQLAALAAKLDGAVALVTGRSIARVDALFEPHRFPVAGLHGAEMRLPDGGLVEPALSSAFLAAKEELRARSKDLEGVIFEDKGAAVALHFRLASHHEAVVGALMQQAAASTGEHWALQHGKMVVELKPARSGKGEALERLMGTAPFRGRYPIAVGDDLTDEEMFAVAAAAGGAAIRVGDAAAPTAAHAWIGSPNELRRLLASIARQPEGK